MNIFHFYRHFNHVLDSNAILRFVGLANNAQLEMVPCTKIRSISNVTIGIQLENGERLMSEFTPNVTLAEILKHVNFNEDLEKIILIYMHREVYHFIVNIIILIINFMLNSN